jgi:hypothetical protein
LLWADPADRAVSWRWDTCGEAMFLSKDRLSATMHGMANEPRGYQHSIVTGGEPMTTGRHYWEVRIDEGPSQVRVGAVRPARDHDEILYREDDGVEDEGGDVYLIQGRGGKLYGSKYEDKPYDYSDFRDDDRVGVLLDLEEGWIRFYRNDLVVGFMDEVTGPLLRAVMAYGKATKVTVLPEAKLPEEAGAADE